MSPLSNAKRLQVLVARTGFGVSRKKAVLSAVLAVIFGVGCSVTIARAAMLGVDIGYTGQTVQSGFDGMTSSSSSTASSFSDTFASTLGTSGNVTVTLARITAGGLNYRNRGTVTGTTTPVGINALVQDLVFEDANGLSVTLSGLKDGTYTLTTYHFDLYQTADPFNLVITDANGTSTRWTDQYATYESSLASPTVLTLKSTFVVSGGNDVIVSLERASGTGTAAVLNGFTIATPEPATIGLMLVGVGVLLMSRKRKVHQR